MYICMCMCMCIYIYICICIYIYIYVCINFKSINSGVGEQFLPLASTARARIRGVFFSQTPMLAIVYPAPSEIDSGQCWAVASINHTVRCISLLLSLHIYIYIIIKLHIYIYIYVHIYIYIYM